MCRVAQKVMWELAKKKKVEIQHVDKTVLERLSGNKPHQVSQPMITVSYGMCMRSLIPLH